METAITLQLSGDSVPMSEPTAQAFVKMLRAGAASCLELEASAAPGSKAHFTFTVASGDCVYDFDYSAKPMLELAAQVESAIEDWVRRLARGHPLARVDKIKRDERGEILEVESVYRY